MVNYRWQCENCDHEEDKDYPITKAPKIRTCSKCGEHALYKLIGTGSMFKMDGTGFFKPGTSHKNVT